MYWYCLAGSCREGIDMGVPLHLFMLAFAIVLYIRYETLKLLYYLSFTPSSPVHSFHHLLCTSREVTYINALFDTCTPLSKLTHSFGPPNSSIS